MKHKEEIKKLTQKLKLSQDRVKRQKKTEAGLRDLVGKLGTLLKQSEKVSLTDSVVEELMEEMAQLKFYRDRCNLQISEVEAKNEALVSHNDRLVQENNNLKIQSKALVVITKLMKV
jgi:hypothetical protein